MTETPPLPVDEQHATSASRRRPILLAVAGVAVVALGVTGGVLVGTGAFARDAAPASTASATPTASADPSTPIATLPGPRSPLGCEELVDAGTATSLIGAPSVLVTRKSEYLLPHLNDFAGEQDGVLLCTWSASADHVDLEQRLVLAVVPIDSDSGADTWTASDRHQDQPYQSTGTVDGVPRSAIGCSVSIDIGAACSAQAIGEHWALEYLAGSPSSARTADELRASTSDLLSDVAEALERTGPAPARYVAPERGLDATSCDTVDPDGVIASALSGNQVHPGFGVNGTDVGFDSLWFQRSGERVGLLDCVAASDLPYGGVGFGALPGGSWSWSELTTAALPSGYTASSLAGADDAVRSCVSPLSDMPAVSCTYLVKRGGAILTFSASSAHGEAKADQWTRTAAEAWLAHY